MKRPVGVTVIALGQIAVAVFVLFSVVIAARGSRDPAPAVLTVVLLLVEICFGVALFRLGTWARKMTVFFYAISLSRITFLTMRAAVARDLPAAVGGLLAEIYVVWAVWYLSKQEIQDAFYLHEKLSTLRQLEISQGPASPKANVRDLDQGQDEPAPVLSYPAKAPAGVVIIALVAIFINGILSVFYSFATSYRLETISLALPPVAVITFGLIAFTYGVGLLKLKEWGRSLAILS